MFRGRDLGLRTHAIVPKSNVRRVPFEAHFQAVSIARSPCRGSFYLVPEIPASRKNLKVAIPAPITTLPPLAL